MEAIVPAESGSPLSSSVNNHIQSTKESTATFRPPTCSELRIHYPALYPESEECSSQDPTCTIIGEFPTTESLPPSPVLPSPSIQAPALNQATAPSSRADSETTDLELDTEEPTEPEPTVTCAGRTIKPANRYGLTAEYAFLMLAVKENPDEPTLQQAMDSSQKAKWDKALQQEVEGIQSYATWEEATPPDGARFIGTKWVLRKKRDENGKLVMYKARLTANGFAQIPVLDFDETFSVVV